MVEARNRAGLWVGNVTLNAVSEVNAGTLGHQCCETSDAPEHEHNATPTRAELTMRLLAACGHEWKARLLRDVIQMWKNGTYTNDASGRRAVDVPGRFVLLTDDALIRQLFGRGLRDGQPVGRRLARPVTIGTGPTRPGHETEISRWAARCTGTLFLGAAAHESFPA